MPVSPELLIFDCDGVLIDSEPVAARVLWQSLAQAGVAVSLSEVHARFTGTSAAEARRICAEELGADPEAVFPSMGEGLYQEFERSLTEMPGIAEFVATLDCMKCVASNSGMERLERSLGRFDLWHAFAPNIFSADMVARGKPAPDLFYFCAAKLGVDPRAAIVIDDSVHGILGAVAAGMSAIGFIDPSDPRENRRQALLDAGASDVATGAAELAVIVADVFPGAFQRSRDRRIRAPATV